MTKYARWKAKEQRDLYHWRTWIHEQPCVVCGRNSPEMAHVGLRGLGRRCSDSEALPLCGFHHAESHADRKFWGHHGLNKDKLVADHQQRYLETFQSRPDLIAKLQNALAAAGHFHIPSECP